MNYQNKSGEALSLPFLLIWLVGDILNLFGAIFTQQYGIVLITAIYFLCIDFILIGQVVYYNVFGFGQNGRRETVEIQAVRPNDQTEGFLIDQARTDDLSKVNIYDGKTPKSGLDKLDVLDSADMEVVKQSQRDTTDDSKALNKKQTAQQSIMSGSSRVAYSAVCLLSLGLITSGTMPFEATVSTAASNISSVPLSQSSQVYGKLPIFPTRRSLFTSSSLSNSDQIESVTDDVFATYDLFVETHRVNAGDLLRQEFKTLAEEPPICDHTNEMSNGAYIFGVFSAWGCGFLYVTSRIPQIVKNRRRQSVENLSIPLFTFPIVANFLYAISMLLPETTVYDDDWWEGSFPYLIGSLGTNVFGFVITYQLWKYRGKVYVPENEENQASGLVETETGVTQVVVASRNSAPESVNRSSGSINANSE